MINTHVFWVQKIKLPDSIWTLLDVKIEIPNEDSEIEEAPPFIHTEREAKEKTSLDASGVYPMQEY